MELKRLLAGLICSLAILVPSIAFAKDHNDGNDYPNAFCDDASAPVRDIDYKTQPGIPSANGKIASFDIGHSINDRQCFLKIKVPPHLLDEDGGRIRVVALPEREGGRDYLSFIDLNIFCEQKVLPSHKEGIHCLSRFLELKEIDPDGTLDEDTPVKHKRFVLDDDTPHNILDWANGVSLRDYSFEPSGEPLKDSVIAIRVHNFAYGRVVFFD